MATLQKFNALLMTTLIPKVSKAIQKEHTGESAAIVNGEFVAFGKNSYEAAQKAIKKGFPEEDIMTTHIMGKKYYVL